MTNLAKTEGVHFKRYKSGNIKWYFGTGDYHYCQRLITDIALSYEYYLIKPLEQSVLKALFLRCFNNVIAPQAIKITEAEAVAVCFMLEKYKDTGFLYHELKFLLRL